MTGQVDAAMNKDYQQARRRAEMFKRSTPLWMQQLRGCIFETFDTPLCAVLIAWEGELIRRIELEADPQQRRLVLEVLDVCGLPTGEAPSGLASQIRKHLCGKEVPNYSTVKLDQTIGTPFQKAVWEVVRQVPYGQTRAYRWVAQQIGRPRAARAVGQAVARNPFPLVVPCHRIVASDGSLGGFSAGVSLKRLLVDLERQVWATGAIR